MQERIDREVLRAVADCDVVDAWQEAALGGVSWLAAKTGLVRNAASGLLRTARFLMHHEQTAKALDAGDVTVPHVELLRRLPRTGATSCTRSTRRACSMPPPPSRSRTSRRRRGVGRCSPTTSSPVATQDSPSSGAASPCHPPSAAASSPASSTPRRRRSSADDSRRSRRPIPTMRLRCGRRANAGRHAGGVVSRRRRPSRAVPAVDVLWHHDVLAGHPLTDLESLRCDIEGFGPIPRITLERLACDCTLGRVVDAHRFRGPRLGRRTRTVPRGSGGLCASATSTASIRAAGPRLVVRRAPSRPLVARRRDQPREPRPAVSATPRRLPRGWLEAGRGPDGLTLAA